MKVVTRARELVAAGWSAERTAELLGEEGVPVGINTVRRWTDQKTRLADQERDRARAARKARAAGAGPMGPRHATPEFKLARMRALRETARLKDAQIARVMALDFGDVMSDDTVSYALARGEYPRSLR